MSCALKIPEQPNAVQNLVRKIYNLESGKLKRPSVAETVVAGRDISGRLHIRDRVSGQTFLLDTGADVSLLPANPKIRGQPNNDGFADDYTLAAETTRASVATECSAISANLLTSSIPDAANITCFLFVFDHQASMKSKRGIGFKHLKQDKFTDKKNKQGRVGLKERIRRDCAEDKVDLKYIEITEEEFLKTPTLGEDMNRRPIQVTVSTDVVSDLTRETLSYLRTQNVEIREDDQIMLERVTDLQVKAKVAKARAVAPVASQTINDPYIDKIVEHLTQVLRSHELLINQYGNVEYMRQLFIPKIDAPPIVALPANKVRTEVTFEGKVLYDPHAYVADPFACPAPDRTLVNERFLVPGFR